MTPPRRSWEFDAIADPPRLDARGMAADPVFQNRLAAYYLRLLRLLRGRLMLGTLAMVWSMLAVTRILPALRHYDAVIVLSPTSATLLGALKRLGIVRQPQLIEIQFRSRLFRNGRAWLGALKRWATGGITSVIVVSEPQAEDLRQAIGASHEPKPEIHFLSSGIDTDYWRPTRSKSPIVPGVPYVVCSGGAERDDDLLILLAQASQVHVVRTGGGPPVARKYWEVLQGAPDLAKHLTYYAHVTNEQLRELYTWATATVLPIRQVPEPCGQTVMFEALSCGSGVITNHLYTYGGVNMELRPFVRFCGPGVEPMLDAIAQANFSGLDDGQARLVAQHHSLLARNFRLKRYLRQLSEVAPPAEARS